MKINEFNSKDRVPPFIGEHNIENGDSSYVLFFILRKICCRVSIQNTTNSSTLTSVLMRKLHFQFQLTIFLEFKGRAPVPSCKKTRQYSVYRFTGTKTDDS
jgi:hypothetical protein